MSPPGCSTYESGATTSSSNFDEGMIQPTPSSIVQFGRMFSYGGIAVPNRTSIAPHPYQLMQSLAFSGACRGDVSSSEMIMYTGGGGGGSVSSQMSSSSLSMSSAPTTPQRSNSSDHLVQTAPVHCMPGMRDVPVWLKGLRLHKYTAMFQEMSYDEMMSLDERQLESRQVTKGARRKILQSVQKLKNRPQVIRDIAKGLHPQSVHEVGCVRCAVVVLRQLLYTPIRPYQPRRDEPLERVEGNTSMQYISDENLPALLLRLVVPVNQLVFPTAQSRVEAIEDEYLLMMFTIFDRITNNEAFTDAQKRRVVQMKKHARKYVSPQELRRNRVPMPHTALCDSCQHKNLPGMNPLLNMLIQQQQQNSGRMLPLYDQLHELALAQAFQAQVQQQALLIQAHRDRELQQSRMRSGWASPHQVPGAQPAAAGSAHLLVSASQQPQQQQNQHQPQHQQQRPNLHLQQQQRTYRELEANKSGGFHGNLAASSTPSANMIAQPSQQQQRQQPSRHNWLLPASSGQQQQLQADAASSAQQRCGTLVDKSPSASRVPLATRQMPSAQKQPSSSAFSQLPQYQSSQTTSIAQQQQQKERPALDQQPHFPWPKAFSDYEPDNLWAFTSVMPNHQHDLTDSTSGYSSSSSERSSGAGSPRAASSGTSSDSSVPIFSSLLHEFERLTFQPIPPNPSSLLDSPFLL